MLCLLGINGCGIRCENNIMGFFNPLLKAIQMDCEQNMVSRISKYFRGKNKNDESADNY